MYVKYVREAVYTVPEVLKDFADMLTGESNVNNLSASCNKTSTVIDNSYTPLIPDWEIWDDQSVASNYIVLRHPQYDRPTAYNYIKITYASLFITLDVYEDWSNVSHVGTNMCWKTNSANYKYSMQINAPTLRMYCGPTQVVLASRRSDVSGLSFASGYFERVRTNLWDDNVAGYPTGTLVEFGGWSTYTNNTSGGTSSVPRLQAAVGTDLTAVFAALNFMTSSGPDNGATSLVDLDENWKQKDTNGNEVMILNSFSVSKSQTNSMSYFVTDISESNELYFTYANATAPHGQGVHVAGIEIDLGVDGKYKVLNDPTEGAVGQQLWCRIG